MPHEFAQSERKGITYLPLPRRRGWVADCGFVPCIGRQRLAKRTSYEIGYSVVRKRIEESLEYPCTGWSVMLTMIDV